MSFCTVINCMDGRVQLPVSQYLRRRFGAEYVDTITEAGPVKTLATRPDSVAANSIYSRVAVSVDAHGSTRIAIAAHHDCAGNPVPEQTQKRQLTQCKQVLRKRYPRCEILALWVDDGWRVHDLESF